MATGSRGAASGSHYDQPPARPALAPGGLAQLQQQTEKASAAGNAQYNRRSGTTGGVQVGMKPQDLKTILALNRAHPDLANVIPSITNPIEVIRGAVQGGEQLAHGVGEIAHGRFAHGALNVGLGGVAAASVLPFGMGAKALEEATAAARGAEAARTMRPKFLGGGLAPRTVPEAQAHLTPLMERAKSEGWGGHPGTEGNPPIVEHGIATPETGGELGRTVRESLLHAPAVREAQKPLHSQERGERAVVAEAADKQAGGGMTGLDAALSELEGRFGRQSFPHLQHLTPAQLHTLGQMVDNSPLQFYDRLKAKVALRNAVRDGVAPTEHEQGLLERVFGKVADNTEPSKPGKMERAAGLLNLPRAVRSAGDLSAAFRQNLLVLATHPGVFAKSFAKSARMFVDPAYHQAVMGEIHDDPVYPLLQKFSNGKLFTEIGDTAQEGARLLKREEAFQGGNVAERLNLREIPGPLKGKKYATGPGDIIRASDRAFTGALNYSRFMVGKQMVEKAALMGHDLSDPRVGKSIADLVGTITGRGKVPQRLEKHLVTANLTFFSPRLIASRLNMLSPVYYKKLDPFARGEAVAAARNMVAMMGTVMVAAKMAGASVNFDPRSSNFGKIRFGNTRVDITGGFNQYIRLIAQEMTRESIASNGHRSHIGWGQHDISDLSNLTKFARSKVAPIPGAAWDELSGKDFIGRPIKQGHEVWGNTPFLAQDILDTTQTGASPARTAAAAFLSAIGFGVQSYKDKPMKVHGGGSVNPYTQSGSGGASSDYAQAPAGSGTGGYSTPAVP